MSSSVRFVLLLCNSRNCAMLVFLIANEAPSEFKDVDRIE